MIYLTLSEDRIARALASTRHAECYPDQETCYQCTLFDALDDLDVLSRVVQQLAPHETFTTSADDDVKKPEGM